MNVSLAPETLADRCIVVVPCYNEAARLPVASYSAFLEQSHSIRLLFVNDGSTDATLPVLRELCARYPLHAGILDLPKNCGKAEAVRQGMLFAIDRPGVCATGFWDADLATPLEDIPRFLAMLDDHPELEMIFGARVKLLGRSIRRNPARHYLGRAFATVVSSMLQLPVYDTQCGAKLFRVTPALRSLLSTPFQSRWIFDVEILARFLALHRNDPAVALRTIYEFPLERWTDVAGSKVHPSDFLRSFRELLVIRATYLR